MTEGEADMMPLTYHNNREAIDRTFCETLDNFEAGLCKKTLMTCLSGYSDKEDNVKMIYICSEIYL